MAAGAVAALCTAFLIGFAAHGAPRTHPAAETSSAMPSQSTQLASPAPQPLAASGLHRNADGVLVGSPHNPNGAIAAAGNYTAALYLQTNRTRARELALLSTIATSSPDAARMASDFASEDTALSKVLDVPDLQAVGVIAYGHPVGYRLVGYRPSAATVDVYVVGGQGVAGSPQDAAGTGETFYEVDRVDLAWVGGDWRLRNWSHLSQANEPALASVAAEGYRPFPIGVTP
jgi:hypothetical protein